MSNVKVFNDECCRQALPLPGTASATWVPLSVLHAAAAPVTSQNVATPLDCALQHGGRRLYSSVTCSCLEIYHEVVTDLLAPTARVQLREDAHKEVWAEGATHQAVASGEA